VPQLNGGVPQSPIPVPELALRRADGRAFSTAELDGKWSFVFFGYTSCPDVCPLSLAYVTQVRGQMGARAPDAYFITVDPARDTPQRLTQYMANFSGVVGLTGTDDELARARAAFGVVAERRDAPESGAGYFMDHTALVYLIGPERTIRVVYPHGMTPADMVADLKRLVR
jgi:protein SCO1